MARENRPFSHAVRAHYLRAVLPRFICYTRDVGINSLPTLRVSAGAGGNSGGGCEKAFRHPGKKEDLGAS